MSEFISKSIEDSKKFAKQFCRDLKPGSCVCFTGDLGSGKTTVTNLIAKELGFEEDIVSPTFNILLQYKNSDGLLLNHFDLYRLESEEELDDIDFFATIENKGISFIEWSEKFPNVMPDNAIHVNIETLSPSSRKISW